MVLGFEAKIENSVSGTTYDFTRQEKTQIDQLVLVAFKRWGYFETRPGDSGHPSGEQYYNRENNMWLAISGKYGYSLAELKEEEFAIEAGKETK